MVDNIKVAILGSTGYVGIELVKILSLHPNVVINFLGSENTYNKEISSFDSNLKKFEHPLIKSNQDFNPSISDVVFLALPHGISNKYVKNYINKIKIIDLSADFRLSNLETYNESYQNKHSCPEFLKEFIYGLSEIYRNQLINAPNIAIPGCYPTSILLPLIPLLKNNIVESKNIIIDSKSGYSGAGRGVHKKFKNKNLYETLSVYGIKIHRHNSEIQQELDNETGSKVEFNFTPHLSPMFRGILTTIYCNVTKNNNINSIIASLKKFYKNEIFVKITKKNLPISTNDVINTNKCLISVCESKSKKQLIILSAIDNLIKGGGGQAIQNMNLLFNFKKNMGLQ